MSIKEHPPQPGSDGSALHVPVLLDAMLDVMRPQPGESYLDLTAGYGGHARAFLDKTENFSDTVLVDRDAFALEHLADIEKKGATALHLDYLSATKQLIGEGRSFDLVVVDLGVSSPQLDKPQRGFSFKGGGPLDMRMDRRQPVTAEDVVNTMTSQELARIITEYGEEPPKLARRIADAIVAVRPLHTTEELSEVIQATVRRRPGAIHPATRTFQALRIHVNDELGQLAGLLPLLPKLLTKGGRVGIISFHSLEDRLVKRFFTEQRDAGYEAELEVLTKKPLAGALNDVHNPRARSAKLRVAVKK